MRVCEYEMIYDIGGEDKACASARARADTKAVEPKRDVDVGDQMDDRGEKRLHRLEAE